MDEIDYKILKELQWNARLSNAELATRVSLSPSPCWNRVRNMERDGIIQKYVTILNQEALGLPDTVIVYVTLDHHDDEALHRFETHLADLPEVLEAYLVSGEADYFIKVAVAGTAAYERFLREKLEDPGHQSFAHELHAAMPQAKLFRPSSLRPHHMNAIVLRALGEPESLSSETWPDSVPAPDDVVVRVHAAALNHRDVWIRRGQYARISLPTILGSDGAGTVVDCGAAVPKSFLGREVVINPTLNWTTGAAPAEGVDILGMPRDGTYAELVAVPAACVFPKPASLSFEEAAALPLAALTAYRAVAVRAKVSTAEKVLVTGIGGGVATFALLIALQLRARVYVTSGSAEKIARATGLGAEGGAIYTSPDWDRELMNASGGPFDAVIDGAGGDSFNRGLGLLRPGGRLVSYGATLGAVKQLEVRRIFWKQVDVFGSTMGSAEDFAGMLQMVERGMRPVVDSIYAFADAASAHRRLESGEQFGKIVLRPL